MTNNNNQLMSWLPRSKKGAQHESPNCLQIFISIRIDSWPQHV